MTPYSDLEDYILSNVGFRDDANTKVIALGHYNNFQEIVARLVEWDELQNVAQVYAPLYTNEVLYTTWGLVGIRKIYDITMHDGTNWRPPMEFIPTYRWDADVRIYISTTAAGKPCRWTNFGRSIAFERQFDDEYLIHVRYLDKPAKLQGSGDAVYFEEPIPILLNLTIGFCWLTLEEPDNAKPWLDSARDMLKATGADMHALANFDTYRSRNAKSVMQTPADYWADPFQRSTP